MATAGPFSLKNRATHQERPILPFYPTNDFRSIWTLPDEKKKCDLFTTAGKESELYSRVLEVRQQTDQRWPDQRTAGDSYSDHYCLAVDDVAVGCLSMTRALHGDIFFHGYYPRIFFDKYLDRVMSAYRFRMLHPYRRTSSRSGGVSLASIMAKEAWREQIAKGVRLDLINVEKEYVRYYQRLGYIYCEGADFICPIFHTPISIMYLPADPTRGSLIKDLIQDQDDPLFAKDLRRVLSRRVVALHSVG